MVPVNRVDASGWGGGCCSRCSFEERRSVWEEILRVKLRGIGERKGKTVKYVIIKQINPKQKK